MLVFRTLTQSPVLVPPTMRSGNVSDRSEELDGQRIRWYFNKRPTVSRRESSKRKRNKCRKFLSEHFGGTGPDFSKDLGDVLLYSKLATDRQHGWACSNRVLCHCVFSEFRLMQGCGRHNQWDLLQSRAFRQLIEAQPCPTKLSARIWQLSALASVILGHH